MYKLFKRSYYPGHFEVQIAGACDTGMSREHNEDALSLIHISEPTRPY